MKYLTMFVSMSFFWALNFPLVKLSYNYSDPYWLLFFRVLFSAIFPLLISYNVLFIPKDFLTNLIIFIMGILNTMVFFGFWFMGEYYVSSSLATIIIYTYPIISLILSSIFLNEKLSKFSIIGSAFGLSGIVLIFSENLYINSIMGFFFLILSATGFSLASVIYRKFLSNINPLVINSLQFLYALPFNILPIFITGIFIKIPDSLNFYIIAFYMGSLGTAVAYLFYMILKKKLQNFLYFLFSFLCSSFIRIIKHFDFEGN